jgi:hypothetical protein
MSNTVIAEITFRAFGRTRDDVVAEMDRVQFEVQEFLGGAPWLVTDDDTSKQHSPGMVLADDQGFFYDGKRTLHFNGPFSTVIDKHYGDGYQVQKVAEGG